MRRRSANDCFRALPGSGMGQAPEALLYNRPACASQQGRCRARSDPQRYEKRKIQYE